MAPPPAPLQPGTVVAGLTIEESGQITWLWVTFFVFGNLFAGFWLALAALNAFPEIGYHARLAAAKLGLIGRGATKRGQQQQQQQEQQQDDEAAGVAPAPAGPDAAAAAAAAVTPPSIVPPASPLRPAGSSGARNSCDLGSPLRSHRSRPVAFPLELCLEQSVTPTGAGTLVMTPSVEAAAVVASTPQSGRAPRTPNGAAPAATPPASEGECGDGSLDAEPVLVKLEWRNLCYAVKSAEGRRYIVQSMYGCANPQELQGLMGPSGAGKSTLMDLLSMRTDPAGGSSAAASSGPVRRLAALLRGRRSSSQDTAATGGTGTSLDEEGLSSDDAGADLKAGVLDGAKSLASPGSRSAASSGGGDSEALALNMPHDPHAAPAVPDEAGQLLINGAPVSRRAFMRISAYVPQHDNLVPTMTALEALSFYASIILPPETPQHTRRARISRVLAMMGLTHAQNTLVGGTLPGGILLRGLSGGERKRLAIACGVVSGPSLVFLDEPTSGLDSFAALNVVLFLKSMATQDGATLIASLHQPRSAIWGQLDQVTLLASGRLMYTGPTDGLVPWFSSLGYHYSPTTHGMASDWALDLVSLGFVKPGHETGHDHGHGVHTHAGPSALRLRPSAATSSSVGFASVTSGCSAAAAAPGASNPLARQVSMMASRQELSDASAAFLAHLRSLHPAWFGGTAAAAGAAAPGLAPLRLQQQQEVELAAVQQQPCGDVGSPFLQQRAGDAVQLEQQGGGELQLAPLVDGGEEHGLVYRAYAGLAKYKALLWRELLITTRNPADVGGRMMTFTYVAALSGLISWSITGGADSIMSRISVAYACLSFYLLMPFVFMSLFTSDKRFFAADTTARLYHPAQYYFAKVTVTLPFNLAVAVVFHIIYYGMTGMRHGALPMVQSCCISVILGLTAMQAVYCCAIVASSQDLAFVYAIAWTALNLLVNPYMALFNLYTLGWGFSWLRYLSPYNYAWQALVSIELSGRGFDCNTSSGLRVLGLIPDLMPATGQFAELRRRVTDLGSISRGQCVASGDAIVAMYTSGLSFGQTVGILLGYFVLFLSVTYLVVAKSAKKRGPSL